MKRLAPLLVALLCLSLGASPARATIDDALSFALEAADPYVKEGFTVREDYWGGDLGVKQTKAIVHQLFKGNTYWFWMGTDAKTAKISVHIYDSEGNLAEVEAWQNRTSPPRAWSRKRRAPTTSSSRWKSRPPSGPRGRWRTGSNRPL